MQTAYAYELPLDPDKQPVLLATAVVPRAAEVVIPEGKNWAVWNRDRQVVWLVKRGA